LAESSVKVFNKVVGLFRKEAGSIRGKSRKIDRFEITAGYNMPGTRRG